MYKVDFYKLTGEPFLNLTKGKIYPVRVVKRGDARILESHSTQINVGWENKFSMSAAVNYYNKKLIDNFTHVGYIIFRNYKEYTTFLKKIQ